jgi:hypothetical protein
MAITRGRGGACGEESRKFDCVSHGSSGDDRRRLRIICRNLGPTRPTRWQWEVCRSIAEKGAASTGKSFLACRARPAGRSNRATPGQSGEHKHDVRFHAVRAITEGRARERRGQRSRISASITMGIQFSLAIDSEFAQTLGISGFDLV